MLQVLKSTPSTLRRAAQLPFRAFTGMRYALFAQEALPPTPEHIIPREATFKDLSFTFAVISLSAHVARADGAVTREEYLAFRDAFPLSGGVCDKIRKLFAMACEDASPFSQYALHIKQLFPDNKDLYMSLTERMFSIATADGPLTKPEERTLAKIARLLDLTPGEYSRIYDLYSRPLPAHHVLGVKKRDARAAIKKRYHQLMRRYHPDRFAGEQTSPEVQMLLTLKSSEISKAYGALTKRAA